MDLSGSWSYILETAKNRLAHNKTVFHVSDYGDGIEVLGVAGEIVARRFFGLPERVHGGFDNGVDFEFAGHSIDVKTTVLTPRANYRFLQWPIRKQVKAEIILLTAVDPLSMTGTVIGYAKNDEVEASQVNYERRYACHEIAVRDLHPAYELIIQDISRRQRADQNWAPEVQRSVRFRPQERQGR